MKGKYNEIIRPAIVDAQQLIKKELKYKGVGMLTSIIPKCLLEDESLVELKDMGIKFEEGSIVLGKCKINCIKVYNLTETQVFDKLESNRLDEAIGSVTDAELKTYSSRNLSIIFSKLRSVANIKDKDLRTAAVCSLLAAVNSLACIDPRQASRFLPIIRGIN